MILYKYVSHDVGMKILEGNSIGFTKPKYFNDPFESEAAFPPSDSANPIDRMLRQTANVGLRGVLKDSYGVLSLTRQSLNPLMWAHYANQHKGMVIGIDCTINEFTCEKSNTIPVQYGNVIYSETKPNSPLLKNASFDLSKSFSFSLDHFEKLQRYFLFKASCWSYEEEVRVVKCLEAIEGSSPNKSGLILSKDERGHALQLLKLPKGAIKEVYLGERSAELHIDQAPHIISTIRSYQPQAQIYGCKISEESWTLDSFDLEGTVNAMQRAPKLNNNHTSVSFKNS
ncbi:DUF2971 domain-containing protein [Halomonas llamarensis]|uniref:DUF2971 domain-containing protein n=1 Tax=Halomonas llamarensis TaxID=2945104 RepID=A0ABT0SVL2_9GAMM|nr:DUF2971 domain-containing protein [Halomonas llamarensis]MCL7931633.1 DUF2971 domain-containing protein [Halomonas llamarensis]